MLSNGSFLCWKSIWMASQKINQWSFEMTSSKSPIQNDRCLFCNQFLAKLDLLYWIWKVSVKLYACWDQESHFIFLDRIDRLAKNGSVTWSDLMVLTLGWELFQGFDYSKKNHWPELKQKATHWLHFHEFHIGEYHSIPNVFLKSHILYNNKEQRDYQDFDKNYGFLS